MILKHFYMVEDVDLHFIIIVLDKKMI